MSGSLQRLVLLLGFLLASACARPIGDLLAKQGPAGGPRAGSRDAAVVVHFKNTVFHLSMGNGVIVRPGVVATARHILDSPLEGRILPVKPTASVRLRDGRTVRVAGVVGESVRHDLILLALDEPGRELPHAPLTIRKPELGEQVSIADVRRAGWAGREIEGTVVGLPDAREEIWLRATGYAGISGAPVFDANGQVVGIVTRSWTTDRYGKVLIAVPMRVVNSLEVGKTTPVDEWARAVAVRPTGRSTQHYEEAAYAFFAKKYKTALKEYEAALRLGPSSGNRVICWNGVLRCLEALGRTDEGVRRGKALVERNPDLAWARMLYVIALANAGEAAEALAQVREAVRLAPDNDHYRNQLALAFANANRWKEGRAAAEESVRRNPEDDSAHFILGWVCAGMGDERAARIAYLEALRLDPNRKDALDGLVTLGSQSVVDGRYVVGRDALLVATQFGADDPALLYYLAIAHAGTGNERLAWRQRDALARLDPQRAASATKSIQWLLDRGPR